MEKDTEESHPSGEMQQQKLVSALKEGNLDEFSKLFEAKESTEPVDLLEIFDCFSAVWRVVGCEKWERVDVLVNEVLDRMILDQNIHHLDNERLIMVAGSFSEQIFWRVADIIRPRFDAEHEWNKLMNDCFIEAMFMNKDFTVAYSMMKRYWSILDSDRVIDELLKDIDDREKRLRMQLFWNCIRQRKNPHK